MALSDNQKLDLMVRAYAEGYQGDFEELFAMEEDMQKGEHPLVSEPKQQLRKDPPQAYTPKPTFKISEQFTDQRAKDLIRSYNPESPNVMPYGDPVAGTFEVGEYSDYRKGGFKLSELAGQPQLDADDYLYNYTSTNTYENGGFKKNDGPKTLFKSPYIDLGEFNASDISAPSDNTRLNVIDTEGPVNRYNIEHRKKFEMVNYEMPTVGPATDSHLLPSERDLIQKQRKSEHLNDNLSQYQPGTQAYEGLSLKDKVLVRGRKKSTQLSLAPQYAFTLAGPSDKQYDLSKDWKGRFRNVGTSLAYFGAGEALGLGMGAMGKGFNKAFPTTTTGLNLRTNVPKYAGQAFEKTGIPGAINYFRPSGRVKSYSPASKNFNKYQEDYYYGLDQNVQLKERIQLAKEQLASGKVPLPGSSSGASGGMTMTPRQKTTLESRIQNMEQELKKGVPARFKGSSDDVRSNPAFYIPGKGGPASKTMSEASIGNYRDDMYNFYYATNIADGFTVAAAKKAAKRKVEFQLKNSSGLFISPPPSNATMGLMGSQKGYNPTANTFGDIFVQDRSKFQKMTDPFNPFFNKDKFLKYQQSVKAHELSHMYDQSGKLLSEKSQADLLKPFGITLSEQKTATQAYRAAQNRGVPIKDMTHQERLGYYMNPTEIAARIREGKSLFNILPGQKMSREQFDFWTKYKGAGLSGFDKKMINTGYKLGAKWGDNKSMANRIFHSGRRNPGGYGSGLTKHLWNEQARREALGINRVPHDDFYKLMTDPRFKNGGYR
tara:strand:- start:1770 stop:4085 length:2316 start_codon:yes stop_codon:yes gene_type:complete